MTKEEALSLMRGAACSKEIPSLLATELTQAAALKMVRHYIRCLPKGSVLGDMVRDRVRAVTKLRRKHS